MFQSECTLANNFDISQLVSEVNSIESQNETELQAKIQQKMEQVRRDALSGNVNAPLPSQSAESQKLLAILTDHWKRRAGLTSKKQRFKSRKQNRRQKRKQKQGQGYRDQQEGRSYGRRGVLSRHKKKKGRRRFKPY